MLLAMVVFLFRKPRYLTLEIRLMTEGIGKEIVKVKEVSESFLNCVYLVFVSILNSNFQSIINLRFFLNDNHFIFYNLNSSLLHVAQFLQHGRPYVEHRMVVEVYEVQDYTGHLLHLE